MNQQSQTLQRHVTPGFQNVFYKYRLLFLSTSSLCYQTLLSTRPNVKKFMLNDNEIIVSYSIAKKTHKQTIADNNVTFTANLNGNNRFSLIPFHPFWFVRL